ncbi:hypothetical protein EJ06DRAFT_522241 [Trichodelitschia bisporula]|uniref:Uncharacterized protein n=1 Tax=Trichodelitschia bisporula TaxID=703511 RepID=A0A6G1HW75_9PEZI|nr:hypothetical protein EJ06DRAFT_522241 [Trichodelitschia bisporula]
MSLCLQASPTWIRDPKAERKTDERPPNSLYSFAKALAKGDYNLREVRSLFVHSALGTKWYQVHHGVWNMSPPHEEEAEAEVMDELEISPTEGACETWILHEAASRSIRVTSGAAMPDASCVPGGGFSYPTPFHRLYAKANFSMSPQRYAAMNFQPAPGTLKEVTGVSIVPRSEFSDKEELRDRPAFSIGEVRWGIEVVRDGHGLMNCYNRFTGTGRYTRYKFAEWVLVDFRTSFPPAQLPLCPGLYFVVFDQEFKTWRLLDHMFQELVPVRQLLPGSIKPKKALSNPGLSQLSTWPPSNDIHLGTESDVFNRALIEDYQEVCLTPAGISLPAFLW